MSQGGRSRISTAEGIARAAVISGLFGALVLGAACPSSAQQIGPRLFRPHAIHLNSNIDFVSDYIFRGVSLSDRRPALQGGFDYEHDRGPFAGIWGSSGSSELPLEVDLYGGYAPEVMADVFLEVAITGFVYPHNHDENSLEVKLAAYPRRVALAWHYDFIIEQHYIEAGYRYEPDRWWFTARGGIARGVEGGPLRPGAPSMPAGETIAWDWALGAGYRVTDALHALAGITDHRFEGERLFVGIGGNFSFGTEYTAE